MRVSKEWYANYIKAHPERAPGGDSLDRAAAPDADAQPQSANSYGSVVKAIREKAHTSRCFIWIESRRHKLIDPRANLYGGSKYIEDALMYAGAIHDDSDKFSEGVVTQTKVSKDEPEETIVRIWKLD